MRYLRHHFTTSGTLVSLKPECTPSVGSGHPSLMRDLADLEAGVVGSDAILRAALVQVSAC